MKISGKYIVDTKDRKEWQKCLNQWRHDYHISIEGGTIEDGWLTLIVYREEE